MPWQTTIRSERFALLAELAEGPDEAPKTIAARGALLRFGTSEKEPEK